MTAPDLRAETLELLLTEEQTWRFAWTSGGKARAAHYAHAAQCVKAAMTPVEWQVRYRSRTGWGGWIRVHGKNAEVAARNILADYNAADCQIRALFALATGGDDGK